MIVGSMITRQFIQIIEIILNFLNQMHLVLHNALKFLESDVHYTFFWDTEGRKELYTR